MWKIVRIAAGVLSIVVGLVFTLLPILPGFPLIIVGAMLLSRDIPLVRRLVLRLKRRWARARGASPSGGAGAPPGQAGRRGSP